MPSNSDVPDYDGFSLEAGRAMVTWSRSMMENREVELKLEGDPGGIDALAHASILGARCTKCSCDGKFADHDGLLVARDLACHVALTVPSPIMPLAWRA